MNFVSWISSRLRLRGASSANDTGITIAVAGVALAIIIMNCTLAIVAGFKNAITERVMGFNGQVMVQPAYDYATGSQAPYIQMSDTLRDVIAAVEPGSAPSLRINQPAVLKTDNDFAGIYFNAFDSVHDFSFIESAIVEGNMPDFFDPKQANSIVLSQSTANSLKVNAGDKIYAYFFVNDAVKQRRYDIAAIYDTGFGEYDAVTAFASLAAMQRVVGLDVNTGTQIDVPISNLDSIEAKAAELQQIFLSAYGNGVMPGLYPVDNVKHTGASFFSWLGLLDTNVVVIFILMACVAGFTLISSMFIIILDRIPTIGLLRALGTSKQQIRLIFANMALKIIAWGMIIGNLASLLLLFIQQRWQFMKLDPEMYYLKAVPVDINGWWMLWLNLGVVAVSWLILMIPARMAASVSPASTLRFE